MLQLFNHCQVKGIAVDEDVVGAKCPWLVCVGFEDWEYGRGVYTGAGDAIESGKDCLGVEYIGVEETLFIRTADEGQRDSWLVWVIQYLASHKMIDRNQELTAYVMFELSYP